ncbi:hypothetical protein quinque_000973 [Culex quinquefasciatus]
MPSPNRRTTQHVVAAVTVAPFRCQFMAFSLRPENLAVVCWKTGGMATGCVTGDISGYGEVAADVLKLVLPPWSIWA